MNDTYTITKLDVWHSDNWGLRVIEGEGDVWLKHLDNGKGKKFRISYLILDDTIKALQRIQQIQKDGDK